MNDVANAEDLATPVERLVEAWKAQGLKPDRRKVCWVTDEILGLFRNGGAGTAVSGFCEATIAAGHELTVLFTSRVDLGSAAIQEEVAKLKRAGHRMVFLQDVAGQTPMDMSFAARSYAVHDWLRGQAFDIVHFHEFNGTGHYACLAKRQGLAYAHTHLCLTIFGSTRWGWECMESFVNHPADLERDFLERKSIENADYVLCHSRYMAGWLSRNATRLPKNTLVQPSIMPSVNIPKAPRGSEPIEGPITEVVFFGRQEVRKGMRIFVEAADILARDHPGLRFTFLGKFSSVDQEHSGAYVMSRLAHIPNEISFLADFDRDEALRYLKRPDVLAVMPSSDDNFPGTVFEAILEGLEFITTNRGGIPEIVHPDCHADRLFEFSGRTLAAAIRRIMARRPPPARLAFDQAANTAAWMDWHALAPATDAGAKSAAGKKAARPAEPLVSLCIVHYNRPKLLAQVIAAVDAQTYGNLEIVLLDDGSPSEAAQAYVASLEARKWKVPFKVVRSNDVGLAGARNAAVAAATGDYVVFIDDDNVPTPRMVERMVAAAMARDLDVATTLAYVLEGEGEPPAVANGAAVGYFPAGGPVSVGLINNVFGDANALVRREVFNTLGGFDPARGVGAEDWDFFARAMLSGKKLEVIPEPLYWYRRHGGQLTARPHSRHAYFERLLRSYWSHMSAGAPDEVYEAIKTFQGRFIDEKLKGEVWHNLGVRREGELQRQLLPHVHNIEESYRLLALYALNLGRVRDAARLMVRRNQPVSQLAALDSELVRFYQNAAAPVQGVYGETGIDPAAPRAVPILRSVLSQARYVTHDRGDFAWEPMEINLDQNFLGVHPVKGNLSAARIDGAIVPGATGVAVMVVVEHPDGPKVRFHLAAFHPDTPWVDKAFSNPFALASRVVSPADGRQRLVLAFTHLSPTPLDLVLVTEGVGSTDYAWARFGAPHLLFGALAPMPIEASAPPEPAPPAKKPKKAGWWR